MFHKHGHRITPAGAAIHGGMAPTQEGNTDPRGVGYSLLHDKVNELRLGVPSVPPSPVVHYNEAAYLPAQSMIVSWTLLSMTPAAIA